MELVSTYSLFPLVGSVLVIVLGFFVWLKKPRELLHILFFFYVFTIAIWLFGTFKLFNATIENDQIFWDRFIYIGVVFIPMFLYHFGLAYCGVKEQKWPLIIGYLLAFIFLPLTQTDYFVSDIFRYKWGVHTIAQTAHHYFLVYFFFYFILFFINLGMYYRQATGLRKKQVGYMLWGYGILDIIGPLAFLPAYGIPVYPVVFFSAIPFALLLTYAIVRHNALDVRTIAVEVIVTLLNLVALMEVFFSRSFSEAILRLSALTVIFVFSLLLVRSVKKEIKRREEVTTLAKSLEQANLRLQEIDRQKTEFMSIASHQLRTPLSIMKGFIELIEDGAYGKPTGKMLETLNQMDQSNEHLVKLVDEFLDVTRIEQGRTKYDFTKCDLKELVGGAVKELRERAEVKKLKLVWCPPKEPVAANCDQEKIHHVVFNFIDNAIKYSDRGRILVCLRGDSSGVTVKVKDCGIGFDKVDEANFFQKFYRGENVKNSNVTGTGLGLFVCNKFVQAHNGKVWATSAGLGKGSEFGFWIPLSGGSS